MALGFNETFLLSALKGDGKEVGYLLEDELIVLSRVWRAGSMLPLISRVCLPLAAQDRSASVLHSSRILGADIKMVVNSLLPVLLRSASFLGSELA